MAPGMADRSWRSSPSASWQRLLEEVTLHQMQFGFRRSRTTTDALFQQLDEIVDVMNHYEDVGRPGSRKKYFTSLRVLATFYDLTAAFNRV